MSQSSNTKLEELASAHTRYFSIYTYENLSHESQSPAAASDTPPLAKNHLEMQSSHPSSGSSNPSLQLWKSLTWSRNIKQLAQRSHHSQLPLPVRTHAQQNELCTTRCYHLQHALSCKATWKSQLTSPLVSEPLPTPHSSWWNFTLPSWNLSKLGVWKRP